MVYDWLRCMQAVRKYYELKHDLDATRKQLRDLVMQEKYIVRFLQAGRIVQLTEEDGTDWGWSTCVSKVSNPSPSLFLSRSTFRRILLFFKPLGFSQFVSSSSRAPCSTLPLHSYLHAPIATYVYTYIHSYIHTCTRRRVVRMYISMTWVCVRWYIVCLCMSLRV